LVLNSADAERIADEVLSNFEGVLAISLMDMRGNLLASRSRGAFRQAFAVSPDRAKNSATLALAVLRLVNEVRTIFGAAKAIITIHENCKLMLLPLTSFQVLIGLVLERSVRVVDHTFAEQIEILIADTLDHNSHRL
jgi:hypothetical protein